MRAHRQTGTLTTDVPSGIARIRGPCRIEIALKAGDIISCTIGNRSGDHLTGKEAMQELSRLGRLRWSLIPQSNNTVPQVSPNLALATNILIPIRAVPVSQSQMSSWPRLHKQVFGLSNGVMSSAKIAETLSISRDLVEQALRDLQSIGVIAMERRGENERQ